jgi:hypothetical protein
MNAVRAAFASLTAGQRWTASLAVALGVVVLLFGFPDATRARTPLPVATVARPREATPNGQPATPALPSLQLAVLPSLADLDLAVAPPQTTTTTTPPPAAGPPPPPSTVCTPPLGITLTGIPRLDALICTVIASLPVL